MKFWEWLKREWRLLRSYRRAHVMVIVEHCSVFNGAIDVGQVGVALTAPLVAELNKRRGNVRDITDVHLVLRGCVFRDGKVNWQGSEKQTVVSLFPREEVIE